MTSQDKFEQSYSEFTGHSVEFIRLSRQGNDSYSVPRISTAYTWWKRAREALAAEMAALAETEVSA